MQKLLFFAAMLLSILPVSSLAQTGGHVHELDTVVVTASHEMKMLDTPASISIITADELSDMGANSISEAIKKLPGVMDTSTSNDSISIRGTKSSMAGGPVILIDGVPMKIGDYRYDQFNFIPIP